MKYYILATVFLFGSFFVGQKTWALNSDIVINEIAAYPSTDHEWIEIWNRGSDSLDIKDWKFWENNTNHGLAVNTSSDSILSPGEYGVICQDNQMFLNDYPNFLGSVFDSSWGNLSESGEEIGLKDEGGNFIERFSYITSTNFSLERKNIFLNDYAMDNWQEHLFGNTVGFQNSNYFIIDTSDTSTPSLDLDTTTETSTNENIINKIFNWDYIKINEMISDPVVGNELVELYNSSSGTVEVSGGSICDSSGSGCKSLSGSIDSFSWLIVDLLSDRYLNNTGDSLVLKDQNNVIVDELIYGTDSLVVPAKGQSLVRKIDGLDNDSDNDWAVTTKPTIGNKNELVLPIGNVPNNGSGGSIISNQPSINKVTNTTTTTKSATTTKVISPPKDPVNIGWKLDWPYGLDVGEIGVFKAIGSADPRGGEIKIFWDFGDTVTGTGFVFEHAFVTSGIYIVTVSASSTAGTNSKKEFKVFVGPEFSVVNAQVIFSDWFVTSTDDSLEYIELKNNSNKNQNISGWKLKNKSGKEYELPEKTIIVAYSTLKFFRSIHHLSFDKNGDDIKLTSPNNKLITSVSVGEEKKKITSVKKNITNRNANRLSVKGIVTVEPKTFGQQFFYISNGTEAWQIYQYKKDFPEIKIGDYISVSGETSNIDGMTRIKIKNKYAIKILEKNKSLEPINLQLEEMDEEYSGALVKISGDITEIKTNWMFVDDNNTEMIIYFKKGALIDKKEFKEGDGVEVVGILNKGKDGWQILPRNNNDIVVIGHTDEVLAGRILEDKNKQTEVVKTYLTTTASGVTALVLGFLFRVRGVLIVAGVKKVVGLAISVIKRG